MQPKCPNERSKGGGEINFSKVHHFWMCYCSFAIGHFLILKNQSERQAIELLFKVQISLDRTSIAQTRVVFL